MDPLYFPCGSLLITKLCDYDSGYMYCSDRAGKCSWVHCDLLVSVAEEFSLSNPPVIGEEIVALQSCVNFHGIVAGRMYSVADYNKSGGLVEVVNFSRGVMWGERFFRRVWGYEK